MQKTRILKKTRINKVKMYDYLATNKGETVFYGHKYPGF